MRIRPAKERDARQIASVHVRGWQAAYQDMVPQPTLDSLSEAAYEDRWRRGLRDPLAEDRTFVAVEGERVVGVASTGLCRDDDQPIGTAELFLVYVDPDRIATGIGRELLRHAERDLAARGYLRATLWVLAENNRARRFYQIAGWRADGSDHALDMSGEAVVEVRYERELRAGLIPSSS
ncbi:MAG: GNAT family N-acetyltransferase [Actinomycetota bacterium]|nr:GNAT family N-acetyltransferase [Actinomycetota bacterium]